MTEVIPFIVAAMLSFQVVLNIVSVLTFLQVRANLRTTEKSLKALSESHFRLTNNFQQLQQRIESHGYYISYTTDSKGFSHVSGIKKGE